MFDAPAALTASRGASHARGVLAGNQAQGGDEMEFLLVNIVIFCIGFVVGFFLVRAMLKSGR